ncbi:MAG: hypothetical protein M3313_15515 [Actinomycetota bacterium]|nr:hypothetical protein [Actinomycetota bacterium]
MTTSPAAAVAASPGGALPSTWPRVVELFPYRGGELEVERWRHPIGA